MKEGVIISHWGRGSSEKALRSDLPLGKDDGGVYCIVVGWEGSRGKEPYGPRSKGLK